MSITTQLHTSFMPAANLNHAMAIIEFMRAENVNVMGLTETGSFSFRQAMGAQFDTKRVLHSAKNDCALVTVNHMGWKTGDTGCQEFNRQMAGARAFFKLNDAVAGKLELEGSVDDGVVYIVAYGSSGSSKAEDMAFLSAIQMACMNVGWMGSEDSAPLDRAESTKIVLMGDWNTTGEKARDAVRASMDAYFQLPIEFVETTRKQRTWAQQQMNKAHKNDHQAKDFVLVSSGLTLVSVEASDRYYISTGQGRAGHIRHKHTKIGQGEELQMLPSPALHFSDHVAVLTSWATESGQLRRTGTLNVMSDAYNAFEFHDSNDESLSAKVDNALDERQSIERDTWNGWIDAIGQTTVDWQQRKGLAGKVNYDVNGELELRRCDAEHFDIWNVHWPYQDLGRFTDHEDFKTRGKYAAKMYSMGNGNYRPDITSFNYADNPTAALRAFQNCVDANDNAELVVAWVNEMLDSIYDYEKDEVGLNPWTAAQEPGKYVHPENDYEFTFAQHAAVCLLMGMWMIDAIRALKSNDDVAARAAAAGDTTPHFRLRLSFA